jgi:hypothetical protein
MRQGATDVVYWQNTRVKLPAELQDPKPGLKIEVKGDVNEYRGNIQIRVTSSADIRELVAAATPPESGAPLPAQVGLAAVASPIAPEMSAPVAARAGGTVPVAVETTALNPFVIPAKGEPQPKKAVSASATPAPALPKEAVSLPAQPARPGGESPIAISSITRQMEGKKVAVEGKIKNIVKVNEDDLLMLEDGTGRVYVPIWAWVKKELPSAKQPERDATLRLQGFVHFPSKYEETLIVITSADDIINCAK